MNRRCPKCRTCNSTQEVCPVCWRLVSISWPHRIVTPHNDKAHNDCPMGSKEYPIDFYQEVS
jgi:hypothetical protein